MNSNNKHILEQANSAITSGDYEEFLSFCTEDTTWNFIGEQILHGKEEVRAYMKQTYREPPKFRVNQMIEDGDYLAAMGEITLKDEQGTTTDYSYCDVWKLREGQLHELNAYVVTDRSKQKPHEGETVTGSGFSYDEEKQHSDESKPATMVDQQEIVELPDLGQPNRP